MKVLLLGGNGNISWHCTKKALELGYEVYVLSRRLDSITRKKLPIGVKTIQADVRNLQQMQSVLKNLEFDFVCDFICFDENDAKFDISLFKNKTKHFVLISSEAIYKRESKYLPFKENTPKIYSSKAEKYISGKIKAEEIFMNAYENFSFPVTIIRPSYTYDTIIPSSIGANCFTATQNLIESKKLLIAGDGYALRTFTHSQDFANAFVRLICKNEVIGNDYHITTDEWLSWIDIGLQTCSNLGINDYKIINIPMKLILENENFAQKDILKQKYWHNIYDNTKIKSVLKDWNAKISFKEGIFNTLKWFLEDEKRKRMSENLNSFIKELGEKYDR